MIDFVPSPPALPNRHQIEPIDIVRPAVSKPPDLRKASEDDPLAASDRLDRGAARERAPGLHFNERNDRFPPGHEIEIVTTPSKAVRLDIPSAGSEEGQRDTLTRHSAPLPRVFPLCRGNESSRLEHG